VKFTFTTAMSHYPWAGSEELWGQAALRLAQSGHNVSALVPRYEPLAPRLQALPHRRSDIITRGQKVEAHVLGCLAAPEIAKAARLEQAALAGSSKHQTALFYT
jgi:hypothetical protein